MENIIRFIVRHFVFVIVSLISIYVLVITFGGSPSYLSWDVNSKFVFGLFTHMLAIFMHVAFYANKESY
jgi:hypothetical protein